MSQSAGRGLRVNGFCYPTQPVAKSMLPDLIPACGLITRHDSNPRVWVGSGNLFWLDADNIFLLLVCVDDVTPVRQVCLML